MNAIKIRQGKRFAVPTIGLALLTAMAGLLGSSEMTASTPVAAADTATKSASVSAQSISLRIDEGIIEAGATRRYCFEFNNYQNVGPVAVSAEPGAFGIVLTTVSTDMERRTVGFGYAYCATIRNEHPSFGVRLFLLARGAL